MTVPDRLVPGDLVETVRGAKVVEPDASSERARSLRVEGGLLRAAEDPDRASGRDGDPGRAQVDGRGWLVLPTLVDAHAHLDKAYTLDEAAPSGLDLDGAIAAWHRIGETITEASILERARRGLTAALEAGVTAVRSHVNYHAGPDPLRGVRALVALREEYRGLVDLQVVAMQSHDRPIELVREAAALGPDLLGACPHLTPDPAAETARVAAVAEEHGLGLDLHTDETLDPASLDVVTLAERTAGWPAGRIRTASHCVSLAALAPQRLREVLARVAAAGVSIVTNPHTNLLMQGRGAPPPAPRGLPPLAEILDAGISLAVGGDNVQDPFHPLGDGDVWDAVALLVVAGHLDPFRAVRVASAGGRRVLGLPPAALRAGDPADFVLVRADALTQAIAERAPDRVVVRGGRVVAVRRSHRRSLTPAPLPVRAGAVR
ncbi:MAG: amidohydrolase family protein [Microbacterium sp.]